MLTLGRVAESKRDLVEGGRSLVDSILPWPFLPSLPLLIFQEASTEKFVRTWYSAHDGPESAAVRDCEVKPRDCGLSFFLSKLFLSCILPQGQSLTHMECSSRGPNAVQHPFH